MWVLPIYRMAQTRKAIKLLELRPILTSVEIGLTYIPRDSKFLRPVPWYKRLVPGDTGNYVESYLYYKPLETVWLSLERVVRT
jgi:hypothetical protein